jgi:lipopolysaccharide export LptBFGC system permease protein LptF
MFTGDYGTFALLWIMLSMFFVLALIVAGFFLSRWLARTPEGRKQRRQMQSSAHENQISQFDRRKAQYNKDQNISPHSENKGGQAQGQSP